MENYSLTDDGFTFLPIIFQEEEIASARDGLWKTINGIYETNKKPETRFWEVGDDKNKIIKIDKPHLCNRSVWNLITNKKLGKALAEETRSRTIQVWHSQVVWKPKSIKDSGNAGWHRDSQYWPFSGVMMDCLQLGLPCQMFPLLQDLSGSYLDQTTGKILWP